MLNKIADAVCGSPSSLILAAGKGSGVTLGLLLMVCIQLRWR